MQKGKAQVEKEDPSAQSRDDRQRGANYSFPTANIMEVGVDFPYKDDCGAAIKAEDLKFVTCVLAAGDQFRIARLKENGEYQRTEMLALKNAAEIRQSSFNYQAVQPQDSGKKRTAPRMGAATR